MNIIPAIDIMGGRVVRLFQGDATQKTVYEASPLEMARRWDSYGVHMIHIVDLDGAMRGTPTDMPLIAKIASSVKAKIELGGGIRDEETIAKAIDAGVHKVVIGTKALDAQFLTSIAAKFAAHVVVGLDARGGHVYTKGWVEKTSVKAVELARAIESAGVKTINYTDIAKDGTLEGPNLESLKELLESTHIDIVASGGVSKIQDIRALIALKAKRLIGVIVGKSLYEGNLDLAEALKVCAGECRAE